MDLYLGGNSTDCKNSIPPSKRKELDLMAGVKKRGTWKLFSKLIVSPIPVSNSCY